MAVELWLARKIAHKFINSFSEFSVKSLIVGDLRRGLNKIDAINIITQPILEILPQLDLWGKTAFNITINHLMNSHTLNNIQDFKRNKAGTKHFQWLSEKHLGLKLNLWLVPFDQWGIASINRTGDPYFTIRLMNFVKTKRWHVTGQRLHTHTRSGVQSRIDCEKGDKCNRILLTPTEEDFFKHVGLPTLQPAVRSLKTINKLIGEN